MRSLAGASVLITGGGSGIGEGSAELFVGSVHTQRAFPGASPYAATKGALEALTAVLAAELGPRGIRVGFRAGRNTVVQRMEQP